MSDAQPTPDPTQPEPTSPEAAPTSPEPATEPAQRMTEPEGPQGITQDPTAAPPEAPRFDASTAGPVAPSPEPPPVDDTTVADLKAENARMAQQLAQVNAQNAAPAAHQGQPTEVAPVVILDGDDLAALAERHGFTADEVYAHNVRTIEDEAAARGFQSSEQGRLLFPGVILYLPVIPSQLPQ